MKIAKAIAAENENHEQQSTLKERWSGLNYWDVYAAVNGLDNCNFDSFIMIFSSDYDPGNSYNRDGYVFDSSHEALAFLRFAVIPSILTDDTDEPLADAETYFDDYELKSINDVKSLLKLIDTNFNKTCITNNDLKVIQQKFNETFEHHFVADVEIHVWGTICDVIKSDFINDLVVEHC